jgi:hypothetical protein
MNVLLICRPAPGVDPGSEFPPHLPAERDVLHALREQGALTAAYSPGGPGAVLMVGSVNAMGAALRRVASAPPRDRLVHDVRTHWTAVSMVLIVWAHGAGVVARASGWLAPPQRASSRRSSRFSP